MIDNLRQYELTKEILEEFNSFLKVMKDEACPANVDPIMYKANIEGIESNIQTCKQDLLEYELKIKK